MVYGMTPSGRALLILHCQHGYSCTLCLNVMSLCHVLIFLSLSFSSRLSCPITVTGGNNKDTSMQLKTKTSGLQCSELQCLHFKWMEAPSRMFSPVSKLASGPTTTTILNMPFHHLQTCDLCAILLAYLAPGPCTCNTCLPPPTGGWSACCENDHLVSVHRPTGSTFCNKSLVGEFSLGSFLWTIITLVIWLNPNC